MANEPNATPPAAPPAADAEQTGKVQLRTRPGYNLVDDSLDLDLKDGEVVEVSVEVAKKALIKHPDYAQVRVPSEDKEQ